MSSPFVHLGSRLGLNESTLGSGSSSFRKSSQSRLLGFVVTAIAKLATYHRELQPRARVSLAKVRFSVLTAIVDDFAKTQGYSNSGSCILCIN